MDFADIPDWDEQPYAADNDFFQDRGSPLPPPSSTPIGVDSSSSRASAPPQSPPRADTSDSDVVMLSDGHQPSPRASDDNAGDDSGDGSGSDESMYGLDPRQYEALRRMMPKVAILKMIQGRDKSKPRRTGAPRRGSDDERSDGGRPLRPGQSRVLRRTASERVDVEIRGDSESSDVEMVDAPSDHGSSSESSESESDLERVVVRRHKMEKRVAGPSSQPISLESDADSAVEEDIGQWIPEEPSHHRTGHSSGGTVRERDLIDYMLTRTRPSRRRKSRKSNPRLGRSGGGTKGSHKLHVVTSGARRSGAARQTTLAFGRASRSRSRSPVSDGPRKSHISYRAVIETYIHQGRMGCTSIFARRIRRRRPLENARNRGIKAPCSTSRARVGAWLLAERARASLPSTRNKWQRSRPLVLVLCLRTTDWLLLQNRSRME